MIDRAHVLTESLAIGDLRAYHAWPAEGEPRRRVIVAHELFGVTAHVRDVCERLAATGLAALAPEFIRGAELPHNAAGRDRGFALLAELTRSQVLADAHAAADFLGGDVALLGLSLGGHIAYLAATELPATHLIALYPGWLTTTEIPLSRPEPTVTLTPQLTARTLILVGDADHAVSSEERDSVGRALTEAGVEHEIVVYPGVPHGFLCDRRDTFDAPAAADAWGRIDAFLG